MTRSRFAILIAVCAALLAACNLPSVDGAGRTVRWRGPAVAASPSNKPSPLRSRHVPEPRRSVAGSGPHGSQVSTGSDAVALTFDDGPDPVWTPKVLGLLRRMRVTATFCLIGVNVRRHPALVRAIARDGHTLCNHSWSHDLRLGSRTPDRIEADLARTNAAIRAAVPGARIRYFRQPGGMWTARGVGVARGMGMRSLHWSVDPQDWRKPSAHAIAGRVLSHTRRGAVVLLHDGGGDRSATYAALRSVLPRLNHRFRLVRLP